MKGRVNKEGHSLMNGEIEQGQRDGDGETAAAVASSGSAKPSG